MLLATRNARNGMKSFSYTIIIELILLREVLLTLLGRIAVKYRLSLDYVFERGDIPWPVFNSHDNLYSPAVGRLGRYIKPPAVAKGE